MNSILSLLADIQPICDPVTGEVLGYVGILERHNRVRCISGNTKQEVIDKLNAEALPPTLPISEDDLINEPIPYTPNRSFKVQVRGKPTSEDAPCST